MTLLYIIGGLLLAALSGLVAVGLLVWEDEGLWQMSEEWLRGRGWGRW